jgi:hypothetical protein
MGEAGGVDPATAFVKSAPVAFVVIIAADADATLVAEPAPGIVRADARGASFVVT